MRSGSVNLMEMLPSSPPGAQNPAASWGVEGAGPASGAGPTASVFATADAGRGSMGEGERTTGALGGGALLAIHQPTPPAPRATTIIHRNLAREERPGPSTRRASSPPGGEVKRQATAPSLPRAIQRAAYSADRRDVVSALDAGTTFAFSAGAAIDPDAAAARCIPRATRRVFRPAIGEHS